MSECVYVRACMRECVSECVRTCVCSCRCLRFGVRVWVLVCW